MLVIDFRNKRILSKNSYSVVGNKDSDVIVFYSHFVQYANSTIYLKVLSDNYADKINIPSENVRIEDDTLVVEWTMTQEACSSEKLMLQLQFEDNGEIAQTSIASVTLGNTLNISEHIEPHYPRVLEFLQEQITSLQNGSVATFEIAFESDTLTLTTKNADGDVLDTLTATIPLSDKVDKVEGMGLSHNDFTDALLEKLQNIEAGAQVNVLEGVQVDGVDLQVDANKKVNIVLIGKVDKTNSHNKVYGTDNSGAQTTFDVDNGTGYGGKVARRDSNNQLHVPAQPTANDHATSKGYVDTKIANIQRDAYKPVDITEYPTLNDFLASTGEEGFLYLYPIDTSEAPTFSSGYYRYIWENNAWLYLGTTIIDLSGYTTDQEFETHTGNKNNPHEVTKTQVGLGNVDNTSDADKPVSTAQQTALDGKVDKVNGKQLSTEDYTTAEKNKVAGIEANAQVNTIEGVNVNNQPLTPDANKKVNIDLTSFATITNMETYGKSLEVSMNSSTYVVTFTLKDKNNNVLSTQTIDLPLESVVVGGSYDNTTKSLILTLDNGNTITIPVADLVSGLVSTTDLATALASYYTKTESDTRFATKNEALKMVELTWAELKALRDNNQLVKGMQYRITDFVTTTAQARTQSANHPFDIIVVADDVNKLNENARAINHAGDTYFANSKLSSWKIKYCLDNDTNRFAWADATNGKGVIYRMIDEFDNDCPYDFKNIQFARYKITACENAPSLVGKYLGNYDHNGSLILTREMSVDENDLHYYYTFDCCGVDYSMNAIGTTLTRPDSSTFTLDQIQCLDCFIAIDTSDTEKRYLNNIVTLIETSRDLSIKFTDFDCRNSTLLGGATDFEIATLTNSLIGSVGSTYIDGYIGQFSRVQRINNSLICNDGVAYVVFAGSQVGTIIDSTIIGGSGQIFSYSTIRNILYSVLKCRVAFHYSTIGTIHTCNLKASYLFYYTNLVDIYGCSGEAITVYCGYSQIAYIYQITEVIENNEKPDMFIMNSNITFLRECSFKELNAVRVLYLWNCSFKKVYNTNFIRHIGITCNQNLNGCNFEGKVSYINISSSNTSQVISNTNIHGVSGEENNVKNIVLNEDYSVEHQVDVYAINHSIVEV